MDTGTGGHHHGALPHRKSPHGAVLVSWGGVVILRGHPDNLYETAERNAFYPVLGLPTPKRPQRGTESDEEPGGLHPERLCRDKVPGFVQTDRDQNAESEQRYPEQGQGFHQARYSSSL